MRYRVITRATVERVYLVDADDEKSAEQASCDTVSDIEMTILEETVHIEPAKGSPAAKEQ